MNKLTLIAMALYFSLTGLGCATSSKTSDETIQLVSDEQLNVDYSYKKLKTWDLDQMTQLMYDHLARYKSENNISALKEGAMIALMRPNEDSILDKVLPIVKSPLDDMGLWITTAESIAAQAAETLRNDKASGADQAGAGIVMENIISQIKPAFKKQYHSGGAETDLMQKIANSNAIYSTAAQKDLRLNLMRKSSSPSNIAKRLIELKDQELEKENKAKEE